MSAAGKVHSGQKETVVKLVELSKITGAVLTVETEVENG